MNPLDFMAGFFCGGAFAMWLYFLRDKPQEKVKSPESMLIRNLKEKKAPKPDLKKARYYQSDAYKREKKFVERMKKGELG